MPTDRKVIKWLPLQRLHRYPPLPDEIKKAVNEGKLAVFIGAGASRLLGCMGWDSLAYNLVDACHNEGFINYKEREALSNGVDHKKTITICKHILVEKNKRDDLFFGKLEDSLRSRDELADKYPIFEELYKLRAVFVTTNVDLHFDKFFSDKTVVYRPSELPLAAIEPTRLYHIHGSILDRDSIVFSVQEYIRHYQRDSVKGFLRKLFQDYVILFVGYGLAELQLLEYLITSDKVGSPESKHFYLMPLYRGEEHILEFEQAYYRELGINVVAYEKDEEGYNQLYNVIKEWQYQINVVTTYMPETYQQIEDLASEYSEENATNLFQIIQNDQPLEDHFFKVVNDAQWLKPLKALGYFDPCKNPRPQETKGEPGSFSILHWNVLDYLEKVSEGLKRRDDPPAKTLMGIVRAIVDYRDKNDERIDNYRTDYIVTKVMANVARSTGH